MATQLPTLPEVERLSPLVIRVLGGNPSKVCHHAIHLDVLTTDKEDAKFTLQGTNTYLIGKGPQRLLIDTGEGKPSWSSHLSSLLVSESATVSEALLTHWHPDHVGGVQDLVKLCPNVKIFKHRPTGTQLNIQNGQEFTTEGATLRAFHCPGHTIDHTAFILSEEFAMFTGDNVLGHGTAVFEDLASYLHSLEQMQAQFQGRAYPGHGAVIEDGNAKIKEYIAHRQQREGQVLKALEDASPKPLSPMEIVTVVYQGYPENLFEAAAKGVLQILEKLRQEGKVKQSEDDGKWQIVGRAAL